MRHLQMIFILATLLLSTACRKEPVVKDNSRTPNTVKRDGDAATSPGGTPSPAGNVFNWDGQADQPGTVWSF